MIRYSYRRLLDVIPHTYPRKNVNLSKHIEAIAFGIYDDICVVQMGSGFACHVPAESEDTRVEVIKQVAEGRMRRTLQLG